MDKIRLQAARDCNQFIHYVGYSQIYKTVKRLQAEIVLNIFKYINLFLYENETSQNTVIYYYINKLLNIKSAYMTTVYFYYIYCKCFVFFTPYIFTMPKKSSPRNFFPRIAYSFKIDLKLKTEYSIQFKRSQNVNKCQN